MKTITLWLEGFIATGQSCGATFCGTYEANSLIDAIRQWVSENPDERTKYINYERLTYWGCKFYDNEHKARRVYG